MLVFIPKRVLNVFLSSKPFRGDQEFKSKENYKYSSGSKIKDIKAVERAGNCYVLMKFLNEYSTVPVTHRELNTMLKVILSVYAGFVLWFIIHLLKHLTLTILKLNRKLRVNASVMSLSLT